MKRAILFFILAGLPALCMARGKASEKHPPSAKLELSLGRIVDHLQESWDAAKSYEASFTQEVISKSIGGEPDRSTGTFYVIKPGKLRWETHEDGGVEILNGSKLIAIQPNARRNVREVDIWNDAKKAVDSKLLNFLSGKSKFRKLYQIKLISESDKSAELKLISKTTSDETYIAEIDKSSYLLRALTIDSVDSRTIIHFSDMKTNVPLKDSLFEYEKKPTDIEHKH